MDPSAPHGPPAARENAPLMLSTDWPQGGVDYIGESTPNAVDSPLMKAIVTDNVVGSSLQNEHIQIYGWIDPGVSSAATSQRRICNTPNIVQVDQATLSGMIASR